MVPFQHKYNLGKQKLKKQLKIDETKQSIKNLQTA